MQVLSRLPKRETGDWLLPSIGDVSRRNIKGFGFIACKRFVSRLKGQTE
jgi:hypothetical protein